MPDLTGLARVTPHSRVSTHPSEAPDPTAGRGKVALVTGASSGIGEATAVQLAKLGFKVVAAARRTERMGPLANLGIAVRPLDLTDDQSMCDLVDEILAGVGRIDVLIHCAGIGVMGPVEQVAIADARQQFEVNVFGLMRLTQLVIPEMRRQRTGRIITVTSSGDRSSEALGAWYHAAKAALGALMTGLREEVSEFGIDVIQIEPGPVATGWQQGARDGLVARTRGGLYEPQARKLAQQLRRQEGRRYDRAAEVARRIGEAATVLAPRQRYAPAPAGMGALPGKAVDVLSDLLN